VDAGRSHTQRLYVTLGGALALWIIPLLTALRAVDIWLGTWALLLDTVVIFEAGLLCTQLPLLLGAPDPEYAPQSEPSQRSLTDYQRWPWVMAVFEGFVAIYAASVAERMPSWTAVVVSVIPLIGAFVAGQMYGRRLDQLGRPPRWRWMR
jgi:hypothetical protein